MQDENEKVHTSMNIQIINKYSMSNLAVRTVGMIVVSVLLSWILFIPANRVYAEAPTDEQLLDLERQIEQQEAAQAEVKKRAAEEAIRKAKEEAKHKADEEAKRKAEEVARQAELEKQRAAEETQKKEEAVRATSVTAGDVFQDTLADGSKGPEMVVIPAGTFQMGDLTGDGLSNEKPVHTVTIAKPFAMGKYEVTFDNYDKFANATARTLPGDNGWGRGNRPVINISWDDAVAYTAWLSGETGKHYRLPSEAEWEYAARAGTTTSYWWGNIASKDRAKYGALFAGTASVGTFPPNPFGLYDTSGNVWEWTQDCWNENYNGAPVDGSAWQSGNCGQHVLRGGSWFIMADWLRSAFRYTYATGDRHGWLGFRLVRNVGTE